MFIIVLDKDKKEISREEKEDSFVPKNGFERRQDGNYYKTVDDPRCISDIDKQKQTEKELKEKREQEEKEKIKAESPKKEIIHIPEQIINSRNLPLVSGGQTKPTASGGISYVTYYPIHAISLKEFSNYIKTAKEKIIRKQLLGLTSVIFEETIPFPQLRSGNGYAKVNVNAVTKCIRIWEKDPSNESPDTVLVDAIKNEWPPSEEDIGIDD